MMNMPCGVIAPVDGDIYYYETMAELDAHEVAGDRRRAQLAMIGARFFGYFLIALVISLVIVFRSAPVLQVFSVLAGMALTLCWTAYSVLELCDD